MFFGFGALISVFFLSMGPENRLKDTFYAYIDYFDMDKRVITHLYPNTTDNDGNVIAISTDFTTLAECQLVYYNNCLEIFLIQIGWVAICTATWHPLLTKNVSCGRHLSFFLDANLENLMTRATSFGSSSCCRSILRSKSTSVLSLCISIY